MTSSLIQSAFPVVGTLIMGASYYLAWKHVFQVRSVRAPHPLRGQDPDKLFYHSYGALLRSVEYNKAFAVLAGFALTVLNLILTLLADPGQQAETMRHCGLGFIPTFVGLGIQLIENWVEAQISRAEDQCRLDPGPPLLLNPVNSDTEL